jgi:hypothetical protein
LADTAAEMHRKKFVGSVRQVLWEGLSGITGLTDNYLRVHLQPGQVHKQMIDGADGLIENVRLTGLEGLQLIGSPTK